MFVQQFISFVRKNKLLTERPTLIALSGGIDSVVLSHLFWQSGWPFALAHVNFQLRGPASEKDVQFCRKLANHYEVTFHQTTVDTVSYAQERKRSVQVAARDFRYEWLKATMEQHRYGAIATAHHVNDSMETVLYNLTKGCGLKGLLGVPLQNGPVIRPLLFATRQEIEAYALEYQLDWREDTSNESLKYRRNQIRHQVIPPLREINPSFDRTALDNLRRWQESYSLYQRMVEQLRNSLVRKEGSLLIIDAEQLRTYPERITLLYEWLKPFGFSESIVLDILAETGSGRQFLSPTHRLVTTENEYQLSVIEKERITTISVREDQEEVDLEDGNKLYLRKLEQAPDVFPPDRKIAYLDAGALTFPLRLRHWEPGDRFQPLGMDGQHQKLQDFFSNQKLSLLEKEQVWLLESGGKIAWIVGMRLDERFRVRDGTPCWEIRLA